MQIVVNGHPRDMPGDLTVQDLLQADHLSRGACAVEVNQRLVPRQRHTEHTLRDGDRVEIVTLVGGG